MNLIDFFKIVMGVWGGQALLHFLLKLFVSRPKRFRHKTGKTQTVATKNSKGYKISQNSGRKILICVGLIFVIDL